MLILSALALAVTGSGHAHAAHPEPAAAASLGAAPAGNRCHTRAATGTTTVTLRSGGRERLARVHVPTGYPPAQGFPLVLSLHGTGSTAALQEQVSRLDPTADAHRFLVVYPQALRKSGNGFAWNIPGTPAFSVTGPDDVGYIRALLAGLDARYCVSSGHVYATGFSGGARMVSQLACEPGQPFAAVAAIGGLRAPTPCSTEPVPVLTVHGTADTMNPYLGHGTQYWTYSVPDAALRWAQHDGCGAAPVVTPVVPGITRTSYEGCRNGATVELDTLTGKGHTWPAPRPDWAVDEVIWRFFTAHALPDPDLPGQKHA
jgi:polyhydroxybutyrate depolymerase